MLFYITPILSTVTIDVVPVWTLDKPGPSDIAGDHAWTGKGLSTGVVASPKNNVPAFNRKRTSKHIIDDLADAYHRPTVSIDLPIVYSTYLEHVAASSRVSMPLQNRISDIGHAKTTQIFSKGTEFCPLTEYLSRFAELRKKGGLTRRIRHFTQNGN